jgi:hypothetical protein
MLTVQVKVVTSNICTKRRTTTNEHTGFVSLVTRTAYPIIVILSLVGECFMAGISIVTVAQVILGTLAYVLERNKPSP